MAGMSPAGPERCGSTICSAMPVATAASKALPPRSRIDMPTAEASQCVELTAPKVAMISGGGELSCRGSPSDEGDGLVGRDHAAEGLEKDRQCRVVLVVVARRIGVGNH